MRDTPHVRVVPVQIRLDLTKAEAEKVARVILAYAQETAP